MTPERNRRYTAYCALTVAGFALFRVLVMGRAGLGDSESYYWAWSQRLDLSYFDHPPMVAWLIRLFTDMGGDTSFWVRMPSVLLFIVIGWLFYQLAMMLFNDARVAFLSILTFNLIPMFGIGALQMVPDIPSAVFYLLFIAMAWRLLEGRGPGWMWYAMGVVMGLGALSKYFAVLLVPCVILLVAMVPEYRRWFLRPEPYLMGAVALLVFSPVLIWNVAHDFPSFKFHLSTRHDHAGVSWNNAGQLAGGQLLYVSPLYLGGLLWAVYAGARRAFAGDRRYLLLASFSAPTLLFFYAVCLWTNDSEPHWPAFGYLTAIVMLSSLMLEKWDASPARAARNYYAAATALAGAMFLLFYIHLFHPILPIKPKYDIVNELYGWDAVGAQAESLAAGIERETGRTPFILAHHWVLCSQANFATGGRLEVACINNKVDQFDFWDNEARLLGRDAIVITDLRFEEPPGALYKFDAAVKAMEIPFERGGQITRRFTLWVGSKYGGLR